MEYSLDSQARFWSKVKKTKTCWLWTGYRLKVAGEKAYGHLKITRPDGTVANLLAHKVAYELLVGPVPSELELDHLCRVRHCVNPKHLEPVPHIVNSQRGFMAQTACRRANHPYTKANTIFTKRGARQCLKCRLDYNERRRAARGN